MSVAPKMRDEEGDRMSRSKNPYPEFLIDEVAGIKVLDIRHQIWTAGYKAGREDGQVIKNVIRSQSDMVMVFDNNGEQIPEYQGQYEEVKEKILKDAPPDAVFGYFPDCETELQIVPRQEW